ncbi:MAG: hypothetical protein HY580_00805 [Nitrospinae bacterium]|nr:hypothetical protein [Nitrospinota bacterium]
MFDCCQSLCSEFMRNRLDVKVEEIKDGIRIDVKPKDSAKVKPFQEAVKNWKEFCECECC